MLLNPNSISLPSMSTIKVLRPLEFRSASKALLMDIIILTSTKPRFRALFAEVDFIISTLRTYICAYTLASIPYVTCSLVFLIYILGFKDTISVETYLLLFNTFNPQLKLLLYIIKYLTTFT